MSEFKIVVYSKTNCPQCTTVKMLLKGKNLPFEEVMIDSDEERAVFYAKCGPAARSMPQIFIDGQRVGGVEGLKAAFNLMKV
jgi:glutaredoxin 3